MSVTSHPVRILHCSGRMNRGGAESLVMSLYRQLDHTKVQFDFLSYTDAECDYDAEIRELGGRIIRLPHPKTNSIATNISLLMRSIRDHGPFHAVHAHTMFNSAYVAYAAKRCGIHTRVVHGHSTGNNSYSIPSLCYNAVMRKVICKYATHYLACSYAAGIYQFGPAAVRSHKYQFFPNAIRLEIYLACADHHDSVRQEFGIPASAIVIGHVGRFASSKNHAFLLRIFQRFLCTNPDAYLLLVGFGGLVEPMRQLAISLNIAERVVFTGVREDIPRLLHAINVFVFPSHFEGLGIALIEAQAAGIPCVVSQAIQPEADLQLGLMNTLSLDQSVDDWCEAIRDSLNQPHPNHDQIRRAFSAAHMDITSAVKLLLEIYGIDS